MNKYFYVNYIIMSWVREYNKICQPYSCKTVYPSSDCGRGDAPSDSPDCVPVGYQPKRHNPGGLKFYMYDYPYHTAGGQVLTHPGKGWYAYEKTGIYPYRPY